MIICEFLIDEASLEYRKSLHDLINSEEWEKYDNRKLNNTDIYYLN